MRSHPRSPPAPPSAPSTLPRPRAGEVPRVFERRRGCIKRVSRAAFADDRGGVPGIAPPSRGLRAGASGTLAAVLNRGRVRQIARRHVKSRVSHVRKGQSPYDAPGSIRRGRVGGSEGPREGRSAGPPRPGNEVRAHARSYTDTSTPRMRLATEAPVRAGARARAQAGNAPSASLREAPPPPGAGEGADGESGERSLVIALRSGHDARAVPGGSYTCA